MFLVVFSLVNQDISRIYYWLKKIRNLSKRDNPVIVLVGTHLDEFQEIEDNFRESINSKIEELLQSSLGTSICKYFKVSCSSGENIVELKEYLRTLPDIDQSQLCVSEIPISYQNLLEKLKNEKKKLDNKTKGFPFLTMDQFTRLTLESNIPPNDIAGVAKWLHDNGIIVHYSDKKGNDMIILNPQSLAMSMADIISFKNNWKNGIVTQNDLDMIWKKTGKEVRERLINMFEKFEIIYPLPSISNQENRYIIPSLLPEQQPVEFTKWWIMLPQKGEYQIGRIYKMDFVPLGFFARLSSRLVHHFPKAEYLCNWRNGLLFKEDNQLAFLSFLPDLYSLSISVRFPSSVVTANKHHKIIVEIISAIDVLLENYYSTEVNEVQNTEELQKNIPCYLCATTSQECHLFSYNNISEIATSGVTIIQCPKLHEQGVVLSILSPDICLSGVNVVQQQDLSISKELGRGGFGIVWKGNLKVQNRFVDVAVKELLLQGENSKEKLEKFEEFKREAQLMR